MSAEARKRWFAELIEAGLAENIFAPADLLQHATPEVLASCLPPDLLARVLSSALSAGAMTAERVLETLTPELCAEHLPHDVLWACLDEAANRSGIAAGNGGAPTSDKRRSFLSRALDTGLGELVLGPDDLLRFATPEILATHLPTELKARLLTQALRADAMNPPLVVNVLGVNELAANLPMAVVWSALAEAGKRAVEADPSARDGSARSAAVSPRSPRKPVAGAAGAKTKLAAGSAPKRPATNGIRRADTNDGSGVWADADVLEVVEESELGAEPDAVLGGVGLGSGDWPDEETNVGVDTPPPPRK